VIEDALAALKAAGWRLNNLYEQDNGRWVANVRRPNTAGGTDLDFARGNSAAEVLRVLAEKLATPHHHAAFHLLAPAMSSDARGAAEPKARAALRADPLGEMESGKQLAIHTAVQGALF